MFKLTPYGGAGSVTGANFLLEIGSRRVLVDCGLEQGSKEAGEENRKDFGYDPASIEILFVTHAHIDHTGLIPKLVKDGFRGEIYSTPETKDIAELMLIDGAKINREKENPLYEMQDVEKSLSLWKTFKYREPKEFPPLGQGRADREFKVEAFDAGHVLGSAALKFTAPEGSMLFTGDLGNAPSALLRNPEAVPGLDYMLIESVYGDRKHEDAAERTQKLKEVVADAISRKGTLLIPVFSLERTQVILSELDNMFESGELSSVPVFLDSPLAIKVTDIYERITRHYNSSVQSELRGGDEIFKFPKLRETADARDSKEIAKVKGPKIILAGSGMSAGGRIISHEASYLPDPDTTILFVGYQAPGTLGREIREGMKKVTINLPDWQGGPQEVVVRAKVESIDGYSAHADSDGLVDYVSKSSDTLKKVFVAMGEPSASIFLAQRLRDELGVDAVVAEKEKVYELF